MAEKQRGSGETERKLEGGEPQTAKVQQAQEKSSGLHPAVYIGYAIRHERVE